MNRTQVAWDAFPSSVALLGRWKAGILFEPAGGEAPGGDRFALTAATSGSLAFYLADATGHGRRGARFWEGFESSFDDSWQRFASEPGEPALMQFAAEVNDAVHRRQSAGASASSSQLCLTAGWISAQRALAFASFGLGVYVFPMTTAGPWCVPPAELFGFRLGWVHSTEWPRFEGAIRFHHIPHVQRLWLASDAFFGDDHLDPDAAFEQARELGRAVERLAISDVLAYVKRLPHSHDDATFVMLEPAGP